MAGIYPIPTGRSSDALLSRRLMFQLQAEQKRLLQVEQQVVTGRRYQLPSEDASSATRALTLQRILEIRQQQQTNVSATQSFLSATDTALGGVADLISDARGMAVQAADTTTSDLERASLALEIQATVNRLLEVGNQQFRGRYLFTGSDATVRPFVNDGKFITYWGNDTTLRTYATQDLLFDSNMPGQELFGAISAKVEGSDLDPILTPETRLADLRGGQGITQGCLRISDGSHSSTVSLAGADTLGDVARLLEANPPAGRQLRVTIEAQRLRIEIDAAGGGNFTIRDEQGGLTAAQLGIVRITSTGVDPIVGSDLNPIVRPTTPLADILGTRAEAYVRSPGQNNDIILEARQRGTASNGVTVQFVDDNMLQSGPGLSAGAEVAEFDAAARPAQAGLRLSGLNNDLILRANTAGTDGNNVEVRVDSTHNLGNAANVSYDPGTRILTLQVDDSDETTVGTLRTAIDSHGMFTTLPDPSRGEGYDPAAAVLALDAGLVGDTGNSGGEANTIYVYVDAHHTTAKQAVTALRANAEINAMFAVSVDPADATSTAAAGTEPIDLAATAQTSGGNGIEWDQTSGLQITNGGQTFVIDIQTAQTVDELLNIINGAGANVVAEINAQQNGISIRSRLSGGDFSIGENGGSTAHDLGLRSFDVSTPLAELNHGQGVGTTEPGETDFTIRRNDGVELAIDISSAKTVGDVIRLINTHPDNLDPATAVTAGLQAYGNGMELVDDNPAGPFTLQVIRSHFCTAAWDLGLVPRGADTAPSSPAAATADTTFPAPDNLNSAIKFEANNIGTQWNGINIEFRNVPLMGDAAVATFDGASLIIEMEDGHTTANTVIAAVMAEGTFRAELDLTSDATNDGSGTFTAPLGVAATTSGGTDPPAAVAAAGVEFAPPHAVNTALQFRANSSGTQWNGINIEFYSTLATNDAVVTFDGVSLRIDIADGLTTANTVMDAVRAEGTFWAELDVTSDPTNTGFGTLVAPPGVAATTAGGTAESVVGTDTNPIETEGVFNSLIRLRDAVEDYDVVEIQRIVGMLDVDFDRLNFGRAEVGARGQSLDAIATQNEDEQVELRVVLSDEVDVDFAQAASEFMSRQATYEATLRSISSLFQMSLLDFL